MAPKPEKGDTKNIRRQERLRLFGEQLAALRAGKGLTQAALGERVGGTQSTVSRWELGEVLPPPEAIFELEEELDLEPGTLGTVLGYVTPPAPVLASMRASVEETILSDPNLDDVGRQAVLAVYRSFKRKRPRRS